MIDESRIARLISGQPQPEATPRELDIARKLCALGEKMERRGYVKAIRQRAMLDLLRAEARQ